MPTWYDKYLTIYGKPFNEVPEEIISGTRERLAVLQSDNPIASIVVIGYNEETHIHHVKAQSKGIFRVFYKKDYYDDSDDNLVR